MKISIITATYNSAATIRDTLESVKNQTYTDIEHIIIDGASKDNTLAIVAEYPHIAKVISEKDKGIYDAMNKGIILATGEIIGILNSDDFYSNNGIIEKVTRLLVSSNVDTVYSDLDFVNEKDIQKIERKWKSVEFRKQHFLFGFMPPHPTFFVRKEIYQTFGLFNISFRIAADYEIMLRFLFKNNVSSCYIPETTILMRNGGESTKNFRSRIIAFQEDRLAWKVNNLKPYFFTIFLKRFLKIKQFY